MCALAYCLGVQTEEGGFPSDPLSDPLTQIYNL